MVVENIFVWTKCTHLYSGKLVTSIIKQPNTVIAFLAKQPP